MKYNRLDRDFFEGSTEEIAKKLLGKILVRKIDSQFLSGKIVEVEAYLNENDFASHSAGGLSQRNKSMFMPAGTSYVYLIYGIHYCFNVVTEKEGIGAAVLIRALEPLDNIALMKSFRGTDNIKILTNGPAKLCQALNIKRNLDGIPLYNSRELFLAEGDNQNFEIMNTKRIGISKSKDLLLRYFIKGNEFVSKGKI